MLAMESEELIRSHPADGVVLMGGCDKTTPGLVMGAISAGLPMIFMPAGPMLRGNYRGEHLGSGSDAWKYWDERRAGVLSDEDWTGVEAGIARSYGHCMTMGTASTMTAITEAMGLTLPGGSSIPAPDANHIRLASASGRRAVEMVWEDLVPGKIIDRRAVDNALKVAMALGCSTNAIIHLIAMAKRAGVPLSLDDFDTISRAVPVIANIRPSGDTYLMEDFFYAGGLRALMAQLGDQLALDAMTVTGKGLGDGLERAKVFNEDVIRPLSNPVYHEGSLAVLRGNLAPGGAVIKPAACAAKFHEHTGPALVFDSYAEMKAAIDRDDLEVTGDHVLVLRNAGPQGGPGMPEWGMLPIPKKLLKQGIRDMVRLSDARMSGTSYGACILHAAPEAHVGGPLALLKTGDMVKVSVGNRSIDMLISDDELAARKAAWQKPADHYARGYGYIFARHIKQADEGCDFDFLETDFGAAVAEPSIF
jgi:dihydroxy-acid dehydratase